MHDVNPLGVGMVFRWGKLLGSARRLLVRASPGWRLDQRLRDACAKGDLSEAAKSLRLGARVDARDVEGYTAAMRAAMFGHDECLGLLVDAGCELKVGKAGQTFGWQALSLAAYTGQKKCVALLLSAGAHRDDMQGVADTAALFAAERGNSGCLRILIEAGCGLDVKGYGGKTVAMWTAARGDVENFALAIARGCDLSLVSDENGWTVAMHAEYNREGGCFALIEAVQIGGILGCARERVASIRL
jgi:ankyrin repeat protein